MTTATLREYTLKDLAQMAKKRGIQGWHAMRKADLIQAIVKDERRAKRAKQRATGRTTSARASAANGATSRTSNRRSSSSSTAKTVVRASSKRTVIAKPKKADAKAKKAKPKLSRVARQMQKGQQKKELFKDISGAVPTPKRPVKRVVKPVEPIVPGKDRVVLMVRDAYWLHVHWELSSRNVQRAQAAMAEHWHTSKPVIRLMEASVDAAANGVERFVRDIEIHGGVNNWYIDVGNPPAGFRVEIGYLAANGHFHSLARSNTVTTPEPNARVAVDHTWVDVAENCERIYALSGGYSDEGATDELQEVLEERLRRPVGSSVAARFGIGADPSMGQREANFKLEINAELIVHGTTKAGSGVTMGGVPLKIENDGTFSVRMGLPDRRQVLPITSTSNDGLTEQTVVLAVERNTKVMEPLQRDGS